MEKLTKIDITGNWHEGDSFDEKIIMSEPDVADGAIRHFNQRLKLSKGDYILSLVYDAILDRKPGRSLLDKYQGFDGFSINGVRQIIDFTGSAENDKVFEARTGIRLESDDEVSLGLDLCNTRPMYTYLIAGEAKLDIAGNASDSEYYGILPDEGGEALIAHGIPFITRQIKKSFMIPGFFLEDQPKGKDRGSLFGWESGRVHMDCAGIKAKAIHFLGMVHNIDLANGSWYNEKGDEKYSHFAGDKAGAIKLKYSDGSESEIPLIIGYNIWYCAPWDILWHYQSNPYSPGGSANNFDKELFCGKNEYREIFTDGLGVVDAVRNMAAWCTNTRFIFSIDTEGREVESIEFTNVDDLYDYPLISAVTIEIDVANPGNAIGRNQDSVLMNLPSISAENVDINPVKLDFIENERYLPQLEKIKHLIYTYVDEKPVMTAPSKPAGYFGPEYDFRGNDEALYSATFLYHNGPECAAHICDTGTGCSSSTANMSLTHYASGSGIWIERQPRFKGIGAFLKEYRESTPGNFRGGSNVWTRGAGELLREAAAFGYDKYVSQYIGWLDGCLFKEANPPHWNRVAGVILQSSNHMVGDIEETGNRENDGHGICMWGRYMVWHWLGEKPEWNEKYWDATKASAEWIQWQLDVDTIYPGARKDVLFTESECAYNGYEIYSTYNCLHGLRLYAKMARQLGKLDEAEKWTVLYERLAQGILDNLIDKSEFGDIFHTEYKTDWQDHSHKLAHLQLATEGDTFTPLEDYPKRKGFDSKFIEIDVNSYNFLMRKKTYNSLRMYGYGQGMMTQSALLLDRMYDAEQFVNMLVDHCYLPRLAGWTCPEGIILHRSGKYYLPVNGYMGQDSHVADSTKAMRIMLGVDDNDMTHLKLVPRFPASWDKAAITGFPALIGGEREKLDYDYTRTDYEDTFKYSLSAKPGRLSIRLGPVAEENEIVSLKVNGEETVFDDIKSGDSRWIWIRNLTDAKAIIKIYYERDSI
ncbi:MAG: hypothetical protein ACYCYI_08525 [Saccharofermentanales bacterium]